MWAGAVAHALDTEFGEFGNRWHTGPGQNIYRGLPVIGWQRIDRRRIGAQIIDDGLDVVRVAQAGNKDAVRAGLEIGLTALKGIAHGFRGVDAGLPVSV